MRVMGFSQCVEPVSPQLDNVELTVHHASSRTSNMEHSPWPCALLGLRPRGQVELVPQRPQFPQPLLRQPQRVLDPRHGLLITAMLGEELLAEEIPVHLSGLC